VDNILPKTQPASSQPAGDWFKTFRSDEFDELIHANPLAFTLAAVIASRARYRQGFNADGVERGEAWIGDYRKCGMTRQQYRTALSQLIKWHFVTTRPTNKGTVARLIDTRIFDPLNCASNQQNNQTPTTKQPPSNHQATTNEERKKEKKEIKSESLGGIVLKDLHRELTELMETAGKMFGAVEMQKCHDRWYGRAKSEPDKLRRILADMRSQKAEGKIFDNPGAYAEDLWKRLK